MSTVKYWVAGALALVVVVAAAGYFLLISPRYSHASDLRSQAQEQEEANASIAAKIKRLQQDSANLPQQQAILQDIALRIPTEAQLPVLTRQLVAAAAAADVDLESINPSTEQAVVAPKAAADSKATTVTPKSGSAQQAPAGPQLSSMHVQVKINGGYFNVQQFLNKLEDLKRTTLITGVSMGPGSPTEAAGNGSSTSSTTSNNNDGWRTLDATIDLTVFSAPQVSTSAPASGAAGSATTSPAKGAAS